MGNILVFILLGIVQGFTEPLPISSSGHLIIFQNILGVSIPTSFEAFTNFGSTLAIIYFFWDDLVDLLVGGLTFIFNPKKREKYANTWNYILKIIVATIPLVIVGLILLLSNAGGIKISITVVGWALLFTAFALLIVHNLKGKKSLVELSYTSVFIIGIFQAIAILPGLSRSGLTLVGALLVGLKNKEAFNFSFIIYIPASIGALALSLIDITHDSSVSQMLPGYMIAFVLAAIFTFIGLLVTKKLVISQKLEYFSIYCFIVGTLVILIF